MKTRDEVVVGTFFAVLVALLLVRERRHVSYLERSNRSLPFEGVHRGDTPSVSF